MTVCSIGPAACCSAPWPIHCCCCMGVFRTCGHCAGQRAAVLGLGRFLAGSAPLSWLGTALGPHAGTGHRHCGAHVAVSTPVCQPRGRQWVHVELASGVGAVGTAPALVGCSAAAQPGGVAAGLWTGPDCADHAAAGRCGAVFLTQHCQHLAKQFGANADLHGLVLGHLGQLIWLCVYGQRACRSGQPAPGQPRPADRCRQPPRPDASAGDRAGPRQPPTHAPGPDDGGHRPLQARQ